VYRILITDDLGPAGLALLDRVQDVQYDIIKAEGVDYRSIAPYMTLAEKIGSLQMQLIRGRIGRVELEFRGEEVESSVKPLTVALLKGMLYPILSDAVNYVNAPRLAEERGIVVSQTRHPAAEDYVNVIL
jgi:D-3-phosphoglycerate dehydrogenase